MATNHLHSTMGGPAHPPVVVDLQRFCTVTAADFRPLGGSRPDAAVVACAAVSTFTDGLTDDVILPPDVLAAALGLLCAPLIVTLEGDLSGQEAYFDSAAVAVRLRTVEEAVLEQLRTISLGAGGLSVTMELGDRPTAAGVVTSSTCTPTTTTPTATSTTTQLLPDNFMGQWGLLKHIDLCRTSIQQTGDIFLSACGSLASVRLPQCLTEVSGNFLFACSELEHVDLQHTSLVRAGPWCMSNCVNLTSITLPPCLTHVSEGFLSGCGKLQHIKDLAGTSLRSVGHSFLNKCGSLTGTVVLPDSLSHIAPHFLAGCGKVTSVDMGGCVSVQHIPPSFLCRCGALTAVQLPTASSSLTSIGDSFLHSCCRLDTIDLRSHTLLRSIGQGFAAYCRRLSRVYLPDTVTEVGRGFLEHCSPDGVHVVCTSTAVLNALQ